MKFYRHKNGSGQKFGLAEVCDDSYLCRDSFAGDDSIITGSIVHRSGIQGNTVIAGSRIERSKIGELGTKDRTFLCNAHIEDSVITGGFIKSATVLNCTIGQGVFVTGRLTKCRNLDLDAPVRIGEGEWDGRVPRYVTLKNELADITVTESVNGKAFIGCTAKKMGDWIKKRDMWAKAVGWDKNITDYLKQTFEMWLDTPYG